MITISSASFVAYGRRQSVLDGGHGFMDALIQYLKVYVVAFVSFFAIDLVWLGVISKKLYQKHLGYLMADKVNWTAGILFYVLFIAGLVFFAIQPAIDRNSLWYGVLAGGFFGLVAYATYDLTNLATIRQWPLLITVVDLAWGTFLNAATAGVSFVLYKLIFR